MSFSSPESAIFNLILTNVIRPPTYFFFNPLAALALARFCLNFSLCSAVKWREGRPDADPEGTAGEIGADLSREEGCILGNSIFGIRSLGLGLDRGSLGSIG